MTAQRIETARKTIPNASKYEIDADGFVYRKSTRLMNNETRDMRRLRLSRLNGRWSALVYTDNGKQWRFDPERLARSLFHAPDPVLTYEDIMNNFKTRPVEGFPRYVVTPYGAIYCIDPPKRGKNAGACYLVHETLKRGRAFVTLRDYDGSRKLLKVDNVVKRAWEY
ncbi:MAG TPA: hypothetical protein DCW74_04200 [Alteromonas australica]|uniref:Uncharacterized protein n=1 Tax=Alteromonas australica TaxID=589873 RepID=A0A350P0V5_9ALTE|nr:hypothetical protein [Alteromonas australica]|tara:strand:- start:627 stop:1127 length:501 start_codon:yes stop_codon:yes gene_type:complete